MKQRKQKTINRTSIYEEFAEEMDLFSDNTAYSDWIFDFRESHLSKLNSKLIKFCRKLKQNRVVFRIMYPMEINRKWKFADVYIPSKQTVIMVTTAPHPAAWLTPRAQFFTDRCKVYELDGYESNEQMNNLIQKFK